MKKPRRRRPASKLSASEIGRGLARINDDLLSIKAQLAIAHADISALLGGCDEILRRCGVSEAEREAFSREYERMRVVELEKVLIRLEDEVDAGLAAHIQDRIDKARKKLSDESSGQSGGG